jgi:hypothetical protein
MSTQEFQSLTNVIRTAGQDLLDRSQTGAVFLPLDETNYVAVGTLAGILHVAGKEFPAESSTARAAHGGITSLEELSRYDLSDNIGIPGMVSNPKGEWISFADVERLLASTAVEQKEQPKTWFRKASTFGPWIECQPTDEGATMFIGERTDTQAAPASPEHVKTEPVNGIRATHFHDEGAIARCAYCGRYSLDPNTLHTSDSRQPVCECGKQHGWSGSFVKPTADSRWSGKAPGAAPIAAAPAAPEQDERISTLEAQLAECAALSQKWAAAAGDADGRAEHARNQALEDAANVAVKLTTVPRDLLGPPTVPMKASAAAGQRIAAAIRSMKRQAISEGEKGGASDD